MKPIITRFNKNNGDIELTIAMFDKDIFRRIEQIELCNPSWFDTEHYNIFDLIKENQKYKEVIDKLKNKTKENIENAKCEIMTLTIGDKAYYQYIEKILDNYVDILKEVE